MNRVSLIELECFLAVAEEANFSRAARRLHLSQPPLSRHIQSLEAKLGVQLLIRTTRTVALSSAGKLYRQDARQILAQLDAATAAVRRLAAGETARLRLAFVGALLDEKLVQIFEEFRQSHPGVQIHLADLPPAAQWEALLAGRLDGAFPGAPPRKLAAQLGLVLWKRERLLAALPKAHRLAGAPRINLSALKDDDWIMVSREAAPAFRRQFDQMCDQARIRPRVLQESERAEAVLMMVATGQGISLLPESICGRMPKSVVCRELKGVEAVLQHVFAYRSEHPEPGIQDLVTALRARRG